MIFRWWTHRRRRRIAAEKFPAAWQQILQQNVALYRSRSDAEQARLRRYVQIFVAEKNWEGCNGLEMTDEIRVTIAGQVAILVAGFQDQFFDRTLSILVYPTAFVARDTTVTHGGVVLEGGSPREGEAWYGGPVILSWAEVLAGGRGPNDGFNLVFHEFAHQLDMLNGDSADGIPAIESAAQLQRWLDVVPRHYRRLVVSCEQGKEALFDCYGSSSMSEFFAVVTEVYFQQPAAMRAYAPELYEVFREFYQS